MNCKLTIILLIISFILCSIGIVWCLAIFTCPIAKPLRWLPGAKGGCDVTTFTQNTTAASTTSAATTAAATTAAATTAATTAAATTGAATTHAATTAAAH